MCFLEYIRKRNRFVFFMLNRLAEFKLTLCSKQFFFESVRFFLKFESENDQKMKTKAMSQIIKSKTIFLNSNL